MIIQFVNLIGDLTDAKTKDKMGSKQILEEWQYYKRILDDTEVNKKTLWLDVRGNHGICYLIIFIIDYLDRQFY